MSIVWLVLVVVFGYFILAVVPELVVGFLVGFLGLAALHYLTNPLNNWDKDDDE